MFDNFTRREKHVITIVVLSIIASIVAFQRGLINQETLDSWELAGMLFIVLPMGIYLVTDRERIERINKTEQ